MVLILITITISACTLSDPDRIVQNDPPTSSDSATSEKETSDPVVSQENVLALPWDPSVQERIKLAFPSTGPTSMWFNRVLDGKTLEWPEMKYLRESAYILYRGTTITPVEMLVYESGPVVQYYNPQEGYPIDAPTGLPRSRQGFSMPAVMVPPYTSLVLIHLNATFDKPCAETTAGETLWFGLFTISYPRLGASEIVILDSFYHTDLGEFSSVDQYCTESGWAYFLVPGISLDPSQLWLEYLELSDVEDIAIWSLSERPG